MMRTHLIGLLLALLLVSCAPMSSGPPPIPFPEPQPDATARQARAGASVNVGARVSNYTEEGTFLPGGSIGLWTGSPIGETWEIGFLGDVAIGQAMTLGYLELDGQILPSAGLYLRKDLSRVPNRYLGISGELGWSWARLGAPIGWSPRDGLWVYTHPQVAFAGYGLARLPVGVAIEPRRANLRVVAEAGVHGSIVSAFPYLSLGLEAYR